MKNPEMGMGAPEQKTPMSPEERGEKANDLVARMLSNEEWLKNEAERVDALIKENLSQEAKGMEHGWVKSTDPDYKEKVIDNWLYLRIDGLEETKETFGQDRFELKWDIFKALKNQGAAKKVLEIIEGK